MVERVRVLDFLELIFSQRHGHTANAALQMRDLPLPNQRKNIRNLLLDINQHNLQKLTTLLPRNFLQDTRDMLIVIRKRNQVPSFATPRTLLIGLLRLEAVLTKYTIRNESHALLARHGNNITLKVTHAGVPHALVHDKGSQTMVSGVLVGLGYNSGWRVGDAEVEDFAGHDEVVERVHQLRDLTKKSIQQLDCNAIIKHTSVV